ncbi:hypothetical protein CLV98_104325 [Dyadobacter jejuensis]|uniref:SatD family protein n=1 Tax=Dyadobacter jejuensis TaxID=1082580 RepID=A0A316AKY9_9BACT|nr:hypothetical protein [Dyadobacter jejuensis]PWJ58465.1 hypothetical protein CLV98_104325 [Dyadobacter jejuensis]
MAHKYAVITADMVHSTQFSSEQTGSWLEELLTILGQLPQLDWALKPEIYRGDSFQGVLRKPHQAMHAALIGRAYMKARKAKQASLDLRVAIGIGPIDHLTDRPGSSDGEAFRLSGKLADEIKNHQARIGLATQPSQPLLQVISTLLEPIVESWTVGQSELVLELLQGHTITQIANKLGISQSAASQRARAASWWAIEDLLERLPALFPLKPTSL